MNVAEGGYPLVAKFRKAEGIDVGGDVRIAGVKVGSVSNMELDLKTYFATVTFAIDDEVKVPDDSLAKITSASLLGDSYIAIDPGGSDLMLEPGEELAYTQGSISLTDLIVKFGGGTEQTGQGESVRGVIPNQPFAAVVWLFWW